MKRFVSLLAALLAALGVVGSQAAAADNVVGAAYTITNAAGGNALVHYTRSSDGSLTLAGSVSEPPRGRG